MTKKQEEMLNNYVIKAKGYINYIAVDSDGSIYGFERKPEWIMENSRFKGYWDTSNGEVVLLGSNKKLINVAKETLRPVYLKRNRATSDKLIQEDIKTRIQKIDNAIQSEEDFDVEDFLMKEKLTRFSQKDRFKQIETFKPNMVIHNEEFTGESYDLEEYQEEFSLIGDLFAVRFYFIDEKRNSIGFQIFIEDDGFFHLWNSTNDGGGVSVGWLYDLSCITIRANKMIEDYVHGQDFSVRK